MKIGRREKRKKDARSSKILKRSRGGKPGFNSLANSQRIGLSDESVPGSESKLVRIST